MKLEDMSKEELYKLCIKLMQDESGLLRMAYVQKPRKPLRSKEEEAIVGFLQENPDKSFTLDEISKATRLDLKTGHMFNCRNAGLVCWGENKQTKVGKIIKTVKTYMYMTK